MEQEPILSNIIKGEKREKRSAQVLSLYAQTADKVKMAQIETEDIH